MNIFEKVFWSLGAVSLPLLAVGLFVGYVFGTSEILVIATAVPFFVLCGIFLLNFLFCEVILRKIWKVDFSLFPTLFDWS